MNNKVEGLPIRGFQGTKPSQAMREANISRTKEGVTEANCKKFHRMLERHVPCTMICSNGT